MKTKLDYQQKEGVETNDDNNGCGLLKARARQGG